MSAGIPESDWARFKEVRKAVLERYCSHILSELGAVAASRDGSAHERYLRAYKLIEQHDFEIARAFNNMRRSTAIMQLGIMRRIKILSDEDLSFFSEQTRTRILEIASL
jgi:hypothetical protein